MIRRLAGLVFPAAVAGCAGSPSPVLPPAPLPALEAPARVERLWSLQVGAGAADKYLRLRPVFDGTTGWAVDHAGVLVAFDTATGRILWERALEREVAGALTLHRGRLLLGTSQGEVLAVAAGDGRVLWQAAVSSEVLAPPRVAGETVVVRTGDGRLWGLAWADGSRRWVYDRSAPPLSLRGTSAPLVWQGMVIAGFDSGRLTALTASDGTVLWEVPVGVPRGRNELERMVDVDADPVVRDDLVYAVGYQGRVVCVDPASGRLLWAREMSAYAGIAVDPYRVFVADAEGTVWALDRFNGATLWKQAALARRMLTGPALVEGHIVVGDFAGYLHWLRRDDGRLVARARMDGGEAAAGEGEPPSYTRTYNILTPPLPLRDALLAYDRRGVLAAWRLAAP